MKNLRLPNLFHRPLLFAVALVSSLSLVATAQQTPPQQTSSGRTRFDVTNYRIEAELRPAEHILRATGDVTFTPQDATRSIVFELNGSLRVEAVERNGRPLTNFVQDAVGVDVALGPNVRVDLGEVVPAGQPVTLRFRWSGALVTPEGGPLATRRLAYVGTEGSYLTYAARWFPFHDYAADRATAEITVTVPAGYEVTGSSDEPPVRTSGTGGAARYRFVHRQPALIGNIVAARYVVRNLRMGNYDLQFYTLPGYENRAEAMAQIIGRALEFYTRQYGAPAFGTRFVVAQVDNETLDAYAAPGMQLLSSRLFDPSRPVPEERLQRETAYQWWGQTVGLKSFDDAWLSQGLAEWSAYALRESTLTGGSLESAQRDLLERALMFEQSASIARAPSTLDDQSAAYQAVLFYKGAMVFRMLRETLGRERFDQLLRNYLSQFRGRTASIRDFEGLTSQIAGAPMRYFFARWVESTGVPEFTVDYQIIRTRQGRFRARGTVRQNFENLRMPVDLQLRSEGNSQVATVRIEDRSEDFDFESQGQPLAVVVDPNYEILRLDDELRVTTVARRGIELYREGQYAEATRQLEEALRLDRNNSWIYYHLGLINLEQQNYQPALDNFQAALSGNLRPAWLEAWARIKRGNAYDALGFRERAVNEYNRAVQSGINHDNAQAAARAFLATPYDPRATTAGAQ